MQRLDTGHWRTSEVARLLALVENERRYYQDLYASLPVAVAVVAEDQSLLAVNREFRTRFGLNGEDLTHVRVADLLPDPHLEQTLAQLFMGEKRQSAIDIRLGPKRLRVVLQHTQGWQDLSESEVLMTVEEIPESSGVDRPLPDVPSSVYWVMDRASEQLTCLSAAAERDFGLPPVSWQSLESWAESRIHPDDRKAYLDFYRRADAVWQASIDYRLIDARAQLRFCRDLASAGAEEIRVMTVDRTEDVRAAMQNRLMARMETAGKLSARLAHVANNLLMIVEGYSAEIMDSLPGDDARRGDIREILNAAARLGRLTSQLNPMPAEAASAGGGGVELTEWAAQQAAQAGGSPARLLCAGSELSLLADQVRQAIDGTVVSAAGRPEEGEAEILFEFEGRTGAEVEARLDPFAGPKIGTDPAFGPMKHLRRLVEAGCQAWVEETVKGARLVVIVPAEASGEPAAPAKEAEAAGQILLVEDEDGLRSLLAKALRRRGCEVVECATAEDAMEALQKRGTPVDLLVTDLTLPGMGGGKLAVHVRQFHPETSVVFMTGAAEDSEAAGLLQDAAGVSLMSKPFAVDELVRRAEQILNRPKARGASAG